MDIKAKVAALSVASNSLLVILKLVVGLMIGSVSVISEAIHSGLDLVAALIAFFSVRTSSLPPDEQHRYGHGKIENVSGTIEAILIFIAAIWIIVEAVDKLIVGVEVSTVGPGLVVMGISAALNFGISSLLFRVARQTGSIALEADALHLRTDVYTSVGVFVGLGLIHFTGLSILDPLIALGVALLIIKASWELTRRAFMPLVDVALPAQDEQIITDILSSYRATGDILGYHKLRTRQAGADRHVDLHILLPGNRDLVSVHDLSDAIEFDIREQLANTSVLIHMEPCCKEAEKDCDNCWFRKQNEPGEVP
ncbi:MAG: cation transporter [Syntrophomonadaceae bacterium]|nr:cation transporter [Syntrophomonadaceae bacterium]